MVASSCCRDPTPMTQPRTSLCHRGAWVGPRGGPLWWAVVGPSSSSTSQLQCEVCTCWRCVVAAAAAPGDCRTGSARWTRECAAGGGTALEPLAGLLLVALPFVSSGCRGRLAGRRRGVHAARPTACMSWVLPQRFLWHGRTVSLGDAPCMWPVATAWCHWSPPPLLLPCRRATLLAVLCCAVVCCRSYAKLECGQQRFQTKTNKSECTALLFPHLSSQLQ